MGNVDACAASLLAGMPVIPGILEVTLCFGPAMPGQMVTRRPSHARESGALETETWSRRDMENLFGVVRASAQSLTKAIGEVQAAGGLDFVKGLELFAFFG